MADEPKPEEQGPQSNISPAPSDVTDGPPPGATGAAPATSGDENINGHIPSSTNPATAAPIAEALSDGTMPTVLTPGQTHKKVPKGKASLTRIYRKADIITTLLTFGGAVIFALLALAGYAYFTRSKGTPVTIPKVTTLDKADLSKLDNFFSGNSAGSSAQVLSVNSSSLFKGRVAVDSDLKVTGGVQVSGTTALGDLTVDKTSTLGVTNVRGSLGVTGPANFQSPVILGAGATTNGNLTVSGNGSFGGTLSAGSLNIANLTVSGTLALAGHLAISGATPSVAPASEAGSGASASVEGNDSSGTITINTGNIPGQINNVGGLLVTLTFHAAYARAPHVVITPVGQAGAALQPYVIKTANNFTIGTVLIGHSQTSYSFDYWVAQ